jgi:CheY-like chemotaxis protein
LTPLSLARDHLAMPARVLVVDDSPTIRKVVSNILSAGHYDPISAEDGIAALDVLRTTQVDLILLDFVMPRMNGYQFCRQLRAEPSFRNLPVVLMSAKGDRIREQFVHQTGAVDAITKPFDARGLVAVVEGALKKHSEGRTRPVPDAEAMPDEEMLQVGSTFSLPPGQPNAASPHPWADFRPTAFSGLLAEKLGPALKRFPFAEEIGGAIVEAITPEVVQDLVALLRAMQGPTGHEALAGDILVIPVAEILQLLQLQRQTGCLEVSSRRRQVTIYVQGGLINLATSRGLRGEFLLGRYLVDDGAISREALEEILARRTGDKPSGEALVELGLVTREQIRKALTRQTAELVFECVRWQSGRFGFTAQKSSPEADQARLGLPIGGLVVEGFRRVDEWRLIEDSFDFEDVLYPDQGTVEALGAKAPLTKLERAVLDQMDGRRTVREILDRIDGSSFELSKIIYQLLNSRLARRSRQHG